MNAIRQSLNRRMSQNRGFSVFELLVSIAIFTMLTTAFLINYNSLNKRIILDTLAHQLAQSVRETQVSAMSVRRLAADAGLLYPGYGLHFDIANPSQFIFFADSQNVNQHYDPIPTGKSCGDIGVECERVVLFPLGYKIQSLCGEAPSGDSITALCGSFDTATVFDIVFTRPNPDAELTGDLSSVAPFPVPYSEVKIEIASPRQDTRVVDVWTTGQISVQ